MKTLLPLVVALLLVSFVTGCAMVQAPVVGLLFTDVTAPVMATSETSRSKVGVSKCNAIIGIATGDCSIEAAMKQGGIRKIQHVDYRVKSYLGLYAECTTTVYGE